MSSSFWNDQLSAVHVERAEALRHLADAQHWADRILAPDAEVEAPLSLLWRNLSSDEAALSTWEKCREVFRGNQQERAFAEPFPEITPEKIPPQIYFLSLALSMIPEGGRYFAEKGIPAGHFQEIFPDFNVWIMECRRDEGVPGLGYGTAFPWFVLWLLPGKVVRFGRLEFNQDRFFCDISVFQHKKSGRHIALMDAVYEFNAEGLRVTPGEKAAFTTRPIQRSSRSVTGFPVLEMGKAGSTPVELSTEEWVCVLQPGDPVLSTHIPAGEPLGETHVRASFEQVKIFYANSSIDPRPKALMCSSWLLDPILQQLLPASSNMVKFQKLGLLLPPAKPNSGAIHEIFGIQGEKNGIHTVPWNNRLKKAMGDYLDQGGVLRGGRILFDF